MTGRLHRVAMGLLVADGSVLLAHRHPRRQHYPDCWDGVGGHIEAGESPEEALVRECREEIGVTVTRWRALDPPVVRHGDDLELHSFVVDGWQGTPANLQPEEHDDLAWWQLDEISGLHLAHPGLVPLVTTALGR
mgnify:CR=1 FL=1